MQVFRGIGSLKVILGNTFCDCLIPVFPPSSAAPAAFSLYPRIERHSFHALNN